MDALLVSALLGLRQRPGPASGTTMHPAPFDSIGRLRPLPLHPFEISEPRAILELVDHPRGQVGLVGAQRRGREGELRLIHRDLEWHGCGLISNPQSPRGAADGSTMGENHRRLYSSDDNYAPT